MGTDLLAVYQASGHTPVRKNATEYAGPCPACGGKDRFLVFSGQGKNGLGRYLCRQCGRSGDAIQFLREFKGLSFKAACQELGLDVPEDYKPGSGSQPRQQPRPESRPAVPAWEPKEQTTPTGIWQRRARKLVEHAARMLQDAPDALAWLEQERGITPETATRHKLGRIEENAWRDRKAWGLQSEFKANGKPKRVWIPGPSLVIPIFDQAGQVARVKFRLENPGPQQPRYLPLPSPGKNTAPLIVEGDTGAQAWAIVESELDAILLAQEASELVHVAALTSASYRPDLRLHGALEAASFILVALDADDAGYKAAVTWWQKHFPFDRIRLWPVPEGKDPTDAWKSGWDLRAWILAGLPPTLRPKPESMPRLDPRPWAGIVWAGQERLSPIPGYGQGLQDLPIPAPDTSQCADTEAEECWRLIRSSGVDYFLKKCGVAPRLVLGQDKRLGLLVPRSFNDLPSAYTVAGLLHTAGDMPLEHLEVNL